MLLKKTPTKTQQQQVQVKGIFVPKEKRIETRNEISRAHFQFGVEGTQFPAKSFSHDHFGEFDVQSNKVEENKKVAALIKKSHFNIGGSRQFYNETSHTASYNPSHLQTFQSAALNSEVKNDLRKAHFKFGNDNVNYETTNKQVFVNQREIDPKSGGPDKQAQEERKQKMRTQHFVYGKDAPMYQSMAKKDFKPHNTNEAVKNLHQSKLNGTELRKSHFQFGSDATEFSQLTGGLQVAQDTVKQQPLGSSVALRKNNFNLQSVGGGDFFTYETVNGTQMSAVKTGSHNLGERKTQETQIMALKQDLRSAHFHLGNHDPNYVSSSKSALIEHNVGGQNEKQKEAIELSKKMQTGYFQIGDEKKRDLKDVQSIYKQTISGNMSAQNGQRQQVQLGLRNSHFQFGTDKSISYVSEAKEKFQKMNNDRNEANQKELSKQLKAHHFTLAETNAREQPKYYESINKQEFNYKGDPRLIRGCIAQEVKDDLRASHFKVGYQPNTFQNSRPVSAMPASNNNKSLSVNQSQTGLNQASSSNIYGIARQSSTAGGSGVDQNKPQNLIFGQQARSTNQFQTSNQTFFKWIQPSIS